MANIARSILDTDEMPAKFRYDMWRDSFSVIFGYDLRQGIPLNRFHTRIDNTLFDQILLTRFQASAASYERNAPRIARDGVDMVMLQWSLQGPCRFERRGESQGCEIGDVIVMDMSQPVNSWHDAQRSVTLSIPRALLADAIPNLEDAHLRVLPAANPIAHLLRSHMLALETGAEDYSAETTAAIIPPTAALAAAAIRASLGFAIEDSKPLRDSLRARSDRVIGQLLKRFDLTPELVARSVPCSRSRLYALYQKDGGVAAYIKHRRLRAVLNELAAPRNRYRTVGVIAEEWGFSSVPSFNRAFRDAFSMTPSEARSQALCLPTAGAFHHVGTDPNAPRSYEHWVRTVLSSH